MCVIKIASFRIFPNNTESVSIVTLEKQNLMQLIFQVHQWNAILQNVFFAEDAFAFATKYKKLVR